MPATALSGLSHVERLALEHSAAGVLITEAGRGRPIVYASRGFERLTGYAADEVLGRSCSFLQDSGTDRRAVAELRAALDAGRPHRCVLRNVRADGSPFWNELTITPIHDADGRLVHFAGVQQDVTERVEAQRASELRTVLLDEVPAAVLAVDEDGVIVAGNTTAAAWLGTRRDELPGTPVLELLRDRADLRAALRGVEACGSWEGDVDLAVPAGGTRTLWVRVARATATTTLVAVDLAARRASEAEVRRLAYGDDLTGLPNRRALLERLDRALAAAQETGAAVGVLFVDLDDFKRVNDTLGHAAGDDLLREVAGRVLAAAPEGALVARHGGDELLVLLPELPGPDAAGGYGEARRAATAAGEALCDALVAPFELAGLRIAVGASVGCALFPVDAYEGEELVRRADAAMYTAKRAGGGTVRAPERRDRGPLAEVRLASTLDDAMASGELELHFQPIWWLPGEHLLAAEALLRWRHPLRGDLLPGRFLPAIERAGAMEHLGRWVLDAAMARAAAWRAEGEPVRVSINVAAAQVRRSGFADEVLAALGRRGLAPDDVVLELTEQAWGDDAPPAALERLAGAGVPLAIDDFGCGHSSLARVATLPARYLKVDRRLLHDAVRSPRAETVLRSVLGLAEELGVPSIVEGVELPSHLELLQACGARAAQGFLLGRPAPPGGSPWTGP